MHILLPIGAIEGCNCERQNRFGLQAVGIYANTGWMRAWHIKRLDPAMPAEIVLRGSGIECVSL